MRKGPDIDDDEDEDILNQSSHNEWNMKRRKLQRGGGLLDINNNNPAISINRGPHYIMIILGDMQY